MAVLAAVRIGVRSGRRTRIWTDCANVVTKVQAILDDPSVRRPNAFDADLWEQVSIELSREHVITIHKVAAHAGTEVVGPVEDWARRHNDLVDASAKGFNHDRPGEFWSSWSRLLAQLQAAEAVGDYIIQLHCTIGEESIRLSKTTGPIPVGDHRPEARLPLAQCVNFPADRVLPDDLKGLFGSLQAGRLWTWMRVICTGHIWGSWVSMAQLYVDYQLSFGTVGPIYHSDTRHWSDPNLPGLERLRGHEFPKQVQWFGRAVRMILQYFQAHRLFHLQCPDSVVLSHWVSVCRWHGPQCEGMQWIAGSRSIYLEEQRAVGQRGWLAYRWQGRISVLPFPFLRIVRDPFDIAGSRHDMPLLNCLGRKMPPSQIGVKE